MYPDMRVCVSDVRVDLKGREHEEKVEDGRFPRTSAGASTVAYLGNPCPINTKRMDLSSSFARPHWQKELDTIVESEVNNPSLTCPFIFRALNANVQLIFYIAIWIQVSAVRLSRRFTALSQNRYDTALVNCTAQPSL
jgi:hypothetical protein